MTPTQIEETALELADATGVSAQLEPEVHNLFAERFRKVLAEKLDAKLEEMAKVEPTPRPWHLSDDGQYILSADGGMIATLYDGKPNSGLRDDRDIARANGDLIFRSVHGFPVLVDALKQLAISAQTSSRYEQIIAVLHDAGAL
jgi:hypothetical protein